MFCTKCGTKALDGALFCQKCGAKLIVDTSAAQTVPEALAVQPMSEVPAAQTVAKTPDNSARQSGSVPAEAPKKKSGKLPIILAVVVLVVLAVILIARNWEGKIDYEASVRAHRPFADSQGLPYTYGEVLDKYFPDAKWDVRESGDEALVSISGKAKGTDEKIIIIVKASPYEPDPDLLLITTRSVAVNGNKLATQDEAVRYILAMFTAYDEGANDLSEYIGQNGKASSTADYTEAMKAYAQKVRSLAQENSDLQFALIDLTKSDILELAADSGSEISVYTWTDGKVVPIMEHEPYGYGGMSYAYLPGQEILRSSFFIMAGAIQYETYYGINSAHELTELSTDELSIWAFEDVNGDGMPDENEPISTHYYVGDTEVTEEVYDSYRVQGDYEWIEGDKSAKDILSILEK